MGIALFAAIGLVGVLAGAANTPLAAGIISIELLAGRSRCSITGKGVCPASSIHWCVSYAGKGNSAEPAQDDAAIDERKRD